MRKLFLASVLAVMLTVGAVAAIASPGNSAATITFSLNTTTCQLTITSTKDISNYTVNGVKTEGITTTTVTISVANGDVITVKSGTSTATFTVTGCGTHVPPPPPRRTAAPPPHHAEPPPPPHEPPPPRTITTATVTPMSPRR